MLAPEFDFMIDAGEGAASAIGIGRLAALRNLFITHPHWDHVAGLFQLLNLRKRQDLGIPLSIWHPPSQKIDAIRRMVGGGYTWNTAHPGQRVQVSKSLQIEPFSVRHRQTPSLGFKCFELRTRRRAEFASLTTRQMSEMVQSFRAEGKPVPEINEKFDAHIFTHTGDTEPLDAGLLGSPEILFHDATYLQGMEREAVDKGHSSLGHALAAQRATSAKVLVGLHLSPQHKNEIPKVPSALIPHPVLGVTRFLVEGGRIQMGDGELPEHQLKTRRSRPGSPAPQPSRAERLSR